MYIKNDEIVGYCLLYPHAGSWPEKLSGVGKQTHLMEIHRMLRRSGDCEDDNNQINIIGFI